MISYTNDLGFETDVLQADMPVLVDFYADWCGPCKQIAPMIEEISKRDNRLKVMKLNIDEYAEVAKKFNVRGIPTLLLFKGGEVIGTQVGACTKAALIDFVDSRI